jgi:hypothetical protein
MQKPRRDLDSMNVSEWTPEEIVSHRHETFALACRHHPDLMESYSIALGEEDDANERLEIMRRGLRETFCLRYPARHTDGTMTEQTATGLAPLS